MKLICITGMDGSGKTTLISSLKEEIEKNKTCSICSPWDGLGFPPYLFKTKEDVQAYLSKLGGLSRLTFILHAVARSLEVAMKHETDILLLDSYWLKYAVTEKAQGLEDLDLEAFSNIFPKPDQTFYLDLSPADSLKRKKIAGLSAYESGGKPTKKDGEEFFFNTQKNSRNLWRSLAKKLGNFHTIDASRTKKQVLTDVMDLIRL